MGRNWIFINYQFGTGSGSSNRLVRFRSQWLSQRLTNAARRWPRPSARTIDQTGAELCCGASMFSLVNLGHHPSGPQAHDAQIESVFEVIVRLSPPISVTARATKWRLMHHHRSLAITGRTRMLDFPPSAISTQTTLFRRISVHLCLRRLQSRPPRISIYPTTRICTHIKVRFRTRSSSHGVMKLTPQTLRKQLSNSAALH